MNQQSELNHIVDITSVPVNVTGQTFGQEVLSASGWVLVDFWAPWCMPCRMVAPTLKEIAQEHAGSLKVAKVNTEQEPELARKYHIRSIPTLTLFHDGKVIKTVTGALPKAAMEGWINETVQPEIVS